MSKLANQLVYLKNFGEGVLTRLYFAKIVGANRTDDVKATNKDYGRIVKKLADAFPNEPKDDLEKVFIFCEHYDTICFKIM
jgi:hypothetical protein